ncbi:MAG: hypothetical protein J6I64_03365 [Lachnospiraceae bacterium]|nr:hypothetical protein [Lachnospiraceae bacterium]
MISLLCDILDKQWYRKTIHLISASIKIINYGVDRLVYISCKPTSLARDLVTLLAGGYCVDKVCAVDMFPNTAGIETVVLLSKTNWDEK